MQVVTWKARTDRHVSLRELQARTGISKTTLNNIESGKTSPTVDQIEKIAAALDVRISTLLISEYL